MKKVLVSILTLIFIISILISVKAATTGGVNLSLSKDTVKIGDEISILVTATDSNKLNTVEYSSITIKDGTGESTTDITVKSVEAVGDNWAKMNNEGKTAFVYSGGATESAEVFKVTLTVGGITEGQYTINIEGLTVYSANVEDDTTEIGTKSVSVKGIVDDTTAGNQGGTTETPEEPKDDENTAQTPSNNSGNTSTNSGSSNSNKKNTTTTKLPQTGVESASVIAIIALGSVAIASYVSYRKYKNI